MQGGGAMQGRGGRGCKSPRRAPAPSKMSTEQTTNDEYGRLQRVGVVRTSTDMPPLRQTVFSVAAAAAVAAVAVGGEIEEIKSKITSLP